MSKCVDWCDDSLILDVLKYTCNECGALCSTCAAAHAMMKVMRLQFARTNMLTLARSGELDVFEYEISTVDIRNVYSDSTHESMPRMQA
jgi:hypothetical protein